MLFGVASAQGGATSVNGRVFAIAPPGRLCWWRHCDAQGVHPDLYVDDDSVRTNSSSRNLMPRLSGWVCGQGCWPLQCTGMPYRGRRIASLRWYKHSRPYTTPGRYGGGNGYDDVDKSTPVIAKANFSHKKARRKKLGVKNVYTRSTNTWTSFCLRKSTMNPSKRCPFVCASCVYV